VVVPFNQDTTNESVSVACRNVGCESWTLRNNKETRLDAFEKKELRKVLRISWTAKKKMSGIKSNQIKFILP